MSPNKIVAALIVALLSLPAFALQAQAQLPQPSDLVVVGVDVGAKRVVGVPGLVNVTIKNVGAGEFNAPAGWSIFVGLNGPRETDCIETEAPGTQSNNPAGANALSPCYVRTSAADGRNRIASGGTVTFSIDWSASQGQATVDATRIYVEILGATERAKEDFSECTGPDTVCENNLHSQNIFVGQTAVRARPERGVSSVEGSNVNTPWTLEEAAAEPCPAAPTPVTRACRAMPGMTVVSHYVITNVGTVSDSYVPELDDGMGLEEAGYVFGYAPNPIDLDPRQSKTARVTITFPETAEAGQSINAEIAREKIRWRSTLNSEVHSGLGNCPDDVKAQGICQDSSLPTFVIDTRRSANITANETWRAIGRGQSGMFNFTINNTGNDADSYNVSIDNRTSTVTPGWYLNLTKPGILEPNTSANGSIVFYVPRETLNGTYSFDVTIKSLNDVGTMPCLSNGVRAAGICRLTFTVHVTQDWAIVGTSDIPQRVVPGEKVTYNLAVKNNGNGWDNVTLDLQSSVNWGARLSNTTVKLAPGASAPFSVTVTPPPNTAEATEGYFFVNGTSSGPTDLGFEQHAKMDMITSKLTVLAGPNIALDTPVNSSFVDLGRSIDYDVIVTNTGNRASNFTIAASPGDPNWNVKVTPPYAELAPNQQAVAKVTLTAPSIASVGEKTVVLVTVASISDAGKTRQASLEGRISGPDLTIDAVLFSPSAPYAGDKVDVSVGVGNVGNKPPGANVTVQLFFVQNGVERLIANKTYLPNQTPAQRHLTERFTWDTSAPLTEGTGVLVARVLTNGAEEIDSSAASNERSAPITLRTFDIRIVPANGLTGRPGELVTYGEAPNAFLVEYRGNQPSEPVTIVFESEHGWLASQSELSLALPRGTIIPVIAKLQIPEAPGASRDRLTVKVIPSLRADGTLTASTTTSVLDEENPKILAVLVTPATARIGGDVTIDALVQDATGVSNVRAFITAPGNETTAVPLVRKSADRWGITQPFTLAGRYRVTVEAVDAAEPPNTNKTRDTIGEFQVTPGSVPIVKLAPDQSTTVRAGSFIKLDIQDPLGVAKASYSVKGVTYDIRGPNWQIDTSTFAPGPVDLTVTAENIYGVQGNATFSFVIDNTPPGISKVTISPENPKANEDVKVTIATDATVQAVEVLVKRDGQVVETINATRKGAGSFELTFNPGEGDYTLDVTARDAAGNSKLAPGAVNFSAKPGSPFQVPGFEALLALAALGVALLVLRRK